MTTGGDPPPSPLPHLLRPQVQALAVEFAHKVTVEDIGVDLQQRRHLLAELRPTGRGRGCRGVGALIDGLHPASQHSQQELNQQGAAAESDPHKAMAATMTKWRGERGEYSPPDAAG